jgi:NAD(P)H dehydrogenase (quinone)
MAKVLVLYYSAYGHIEAMAHALGEGAWEIGAQMDVKHVPEIVPEAITRGANFKLDQPAPIATVEELANYDAIVVGSGTRFGRISSQMAGRIPRSGGRLVGPRRAAREGGWRIHLDRRPAWRSGNDPVQHDHEPAAFRHDDRRPRLRPCRADDAGGDHWRLTLWRDHDRRRGWFPPAKCNELLGARYQGRKIAEVANKLRG